MRYGFLTSAGAVAVLAVLGGCDRADEQRAGAQNARGQQGALEAKPHRTVTDADIQHAVYNDLLFDGSVPSHRIDLAVEDGVVTLKGSTESLLAQQRAVTLAQAVKGVRAVVNRVEVMASGRSDAQIRSDIKQALFLDPAADSYEVDVSVAAGAVTLTGNVDSWAERRLAEHVVAGVSGVRSIENKIDVKYAHVRPDAEIARDIKGRLRADALVDDALVKVDVANQHVSLSGTVGSAAERRRAMDDAWVAGVTSVTADDLKVEWWARDRLRRRPGDRIKTDEQIKEAVLAAFLHDPRVASYKPKIYVRNGVVTVSGLVHDLAAKRAAEQDARNTVGVWRVKNYLAVRPPETVTDAQLKERVVRALAWNPYISRRDIMLEVTNGKVFLNGIVDSEFERAQAKDVVARVKGVVDVENDLHVRWKTVADWELRHDIEDQLFWNPYVLSEKVTVNVDSGIATLAGIVDDWRAYREAVDAALDAGARQVINRLEVKNAG